MLPIISFLTGVNASEPNRSGEWFSMSVCFAPEFETRMIGSVPKRVVNDSAASRKSEVGMALPLEESVGTLTKDFFRVSNQVPPGGIAAWNAIVICRSPNGSFCRSVMFSPPLEVWI